MKHNNYMMSAQDRARSQARGNILQGSGKSILTGEFSASPYGESTVAASKAMYGGLVSQTYAAMFAALTKPGIVYTSMSSTTGQWRNDWKDVGDSSTTEELITPFMNYFTTAGIIPSVFEDYKTATRSFTTLPGTFLNINTGTDKYMMIHFEAIRTNNLESMEFEAKLTDFFSTTIGDLFTVTKKFASNCDSASLTIPVMNFGSRFSQTYTQNGDVDEFGGSQETQVLRAVAQPNIIVKPDNTEEGFAIEYRASNCTVYVTAIPFTMGNVIDVLGFSTLSTSTQFVSLDAVKR